MAEAPAAVARGPVPAAARRSWCLIRMRNLPGRQALWPMLSFLDVDGRPVGARFYLSPSPLGIRGRYWAVAYVSAAAARFSVDTIDSPASAAAAKLAFRPVPRAAALLLIASTVPRIVPRLLGFALRGRFKRARVELASLSTSIHQPRSYGLWIAAFDTWPAAPPGWARDRATIATLVFHRGEEESEPLRATLDSLAAQGMPMPHAVLAGAASGRWRDAVTALEADYVAILQAGETMPRHAAWLAGVELRRQKNPPVAYGDADTIDPDGVRADPLFHPQPNRALMLSGTLTRGAWFVRRDVLLAHDGESDPGWAERLRLDLWLRRAEAGQTVGCRMPFILTHRRTDAEAAPAAELAAAVNAHLARTRMPLRAEPGFPLILRATAETPAEPVSIVIPSALGSTLVVDCMRSILRDTAFPAFEMVVGVSQPGPLSESQRAAAARIEADPRARVVHLPVRRFNFSRACNQLAAMARHDRILLLNDDISVLSRAWLREMLAHLQDPRVGIVGAKLVYPDLRIQHGGVIIGLAGLCDHAHRLLPAPSPGYAGRAILAQELSAVTAACLLVRRRVFEALGGLDEAYPSAFNDVDFCLRAREAGHGIVFAPAAELVHHESLTYGSHFAGERAAFQQAETERMRRRWQSVVENDPFHNPNLDLTPGREWHPAFPPRRIYPRGMAMGLPPHTPA